MGKWCPTQKAIPFEDLKDEFQETVDRLSGAIGPDERTLHLRQGIKEMRDLCALREASRATEARIRRRMEDPNDRMRELAALREAQSREYRSGLHGNYGHPYWPRKSKS